MTKLVQNDIASLTNEQSALAALNANYGSLELFSDSVLSRDGTTPNQMNADLDMNSNQILNIGDPLDMNGARIVGLDDGVDLDEPATVNQLNNAIISGGGVPSNVSMVTVNAEPTLLNSRKLAVTGSGLSLINAAGNITVDLDNDLDAIASLSTTGLATRTATDTWTTRTLQPPAAGITITNPAGIAGDPTLVLANDLAALEAMSGTGIAVHTGTSTWTERSLAAPAAGFTITNNTGVGGNPTFVLANDLNALEGLSTTGLVARTAADTMTTRTVTGTANEITLTNGSGVSGDPTVSIPTAVTFTGKTITGGTFSGPIITGTEDVQQNIQWSGDISPASFGTQQDNYSPTGLSTASTLRLTASAPADITGLAGGADGRILTIHNIGSSTITLKDESASSTAANRFALATDVAMTTDMMCLLQYDSTSTRWRVVSGGGGGGGGASTAEAYVTIGNTGGLSAERALAVSGLATLTDGGANASVTIGSPAASQSDQETGTSNTVSVTPGVQRFHPSAAKAWGTVTYVGGINAPALEEVFNVTSVTDGTANDTTFNFTTAFTAATYTVLASGSTALTIQAADRATGSILINHSVAEATTTRIFMAAFGDQ